MNKKPIRSPSYPSMALSDAVEAVRKIEAEYVTSAVDREIAAKLIGYSSLSGPANKALAALASYGLVERAGKGMMKVSGRARAILHPDSEDEKTENLRAAALEPRLFQDIKERFPDIAIPPEAGVINYLRREEFNPSAVRPAAKAFLETMAFVETLRESDSHVPDGDTGAESYSPDDDTTFGGASVGDLIQWENQGALQLEKPRRVRAISADGLWVAVEGSDTGIPMSQVIVETPAPPMPPQFPPEQPAVAEAVPKGFSEWFRAKVGPDKLVTINFKGEGEIGPKEIEKMIRVLEAQKLALED
ncbi:hypothetical protein MWU52_05780 [Jannaschia sp. S6380]|uniref:hypothetical protein n=1 Tax=Jannaschia sp. S6380 TaxID=2926408 RepID=UPI001FF4421C|nr:hypothetical protein [Jannaschia sp. S6380]MCK0167053.1 hypothetical protein [Jannaschia sp. S6380]